jgi:hypothetical protein
MSEFVFLYRRTATNRTPQQMQESIEKWQAWFKKMEQGGHLASFGQPLDPTGGRVIKDKSGGCTDGPYAETKDIVVGYSLISAKDLDEAAALTIGHPTFDEGGLIEIRPILKM